MSGTIHTIDSCVVDEERYGYYIQNGLTEGERVRITEKQFKDAKYLGEEDS